MTIPSHLTRVLPLLDAGFRVSGLKTWRAREGQGYQYTLLYGGAKVAFVHNDGNGGTSRVNWFGLRWDGIPMSTYEGETGVNKRKREASAKVSKPAHDVFQTLLAATPPVTTLPGKPLAVTADWILDEMLNYVDLAKQCRKATLFLLPGEEESKSYHCFRAPLDAPLKTRVLTQFPTATILNEVIAKYAA